MTSKATAIALTLLGTSAAFAQGLGSAPLTLNNNKLALDAQGQRLVLPLPDWVEGEITLAELAAEATVKYLDEAGQVQLELYPAGQNELFWTTLYGARLSSRGEMSLSEFRATVINVYAQGCRPEAVALFQMEADKGDEIPPLGYICGAYADHIVDFIGEGEIMVMGFYRSETGIGMVYQEWRSPAFNANDKDAWPVAPDLIQSRLAELKRDVSLLRAD